jgi:hypothetical protein
MLCLIIFSLLGIIGLFLQRERERERERENIFFASKASQVLGHQYDHYFIFFHNYCHDHYYCNFHDQCYNTINISSSYIYTTLYPTVSKYAQSTIPITLYLVVLHSFPFFASGHQLA